MNTPPPLPRAADVRLVRDLDSSLLELERSVSALDLVIFELAGDARADQTGVPALVRRRLILSEASDLGEDEMHGGSARLMYLAALAWAIDEPELAPDEEPVDGDWAQTVLASAARSWISIARGRPGDAREHVRLLRSRKDAEEEPYLRGIGQQRVAAELELSALWHLSAAADALAVSDQQRALQQLGWSRYGADQSGAADTEDISATASQMGALVAFRSGLPGFWLWEAEAPHPGSTGVRSSTSDVDPYAGQ